MNFSPTRQPIVSDAPGPLQAAWSSYLMFAKANGHDLMPFDQWAARRTGDGEARKQILSPGTTITHSMPKPVEERAFVPAKPLVPKSITNLGTRFTGDAGIPRHGVPVDEHEAIDPKSGEVTTAQPTIRADY